MKNMISSSFRLLALLLCSALALAKTPDNNALHITSRIMYVDVVVRDSSGRIVRGLTEKDFRVLEDGKPQTVTLLVLLRR